MNSTCPYAHVSYATWRLQSLRRLFLGPRGGGQLRFHVPCPGLTLNRSSRCHEFHASPTCSRNWKKDFRRSAKHNLEKAKARQSQSQSQDQSIQQKADEEWNPYTESGLADLESMVESLRQQVKELDRSAAGETDVSPGSGSIFYVKKDRDQPNSPLERRLPGGPPAKLQVHEVDSDKRLENNVWAQILASPLRLDKGTKARIPRDLMNTWGIIRNPKDKEDYILPIELSDSEGLRQELQPGAANDDQAASKEEGDSDDFLQQHKNVHPGKRIHILPDQLLVEAMTDEFTASLLNKKQEFKGTKTLSGKLAGTLVPPRWRLRQEETEAFADTRRQFNEVTKQEPDGDEPDPESSANLDKLQWQPDVAERMVKIMQERIVVALEAVGRDNLSRRTIHKRRVLALAVPRNGRFDADEEGRLVESVEKWRKEEAESSEAPTPDWVHGAIFLHVGKPEEYSRIAEQWEVELQDGQTHSPQLDNLVSNDLIPPMITINNQIELPVFNLEALFRPENVSRLRDTLARSKIFDIEFWNQFPTVQSQNHDHKHQERTQAFETSNSTSGIESPISKSPLDAGESVLDAIINPQTNTMSAASDSPSSSPSSSSFTATANNEAATPPSDPGSTPPTDNEPYIILLKPQATHSHILAREIWQLWRFLGGRPGLYL